MTTRVERVTEGRSAA